MVRVQLRAVRVDLQSNTPVLLLQETEGEGRTLPIFIGSPEATAIAYSLQGVVMPRPLTHDLMKDVLDALGVAVDHVIITELRASTYYAELHLVHGEQKTIVSSRPSDAVALAVRTEAPLYVSDELMESEGIILALESDEEDDDTPPDELVGPIPPVPRPGAPGGFRSVTPRWWALAVAGAGLALSACSSTPTAEHQTHRSDHRAPAAHHVDHVDHVVDVHAGLHHDHCLRGERCNTVTGSVGQQQGAAGTGTGVVTVTNVGVFGLHGRRVSPRWRSSRAVGHR